MVEFHMETCFTMYTRVCESLDPSHDENAESEQRRCDREGDVPGAVQESVRTSAHRISAETAIS
jgi:hypothetical protein